MALRTSIKLRCDPLATEHHGQTVRIGRRRRYRRYRRVAHSVVWTNLGGVTWVFVWVRVSVLLATFAIAPFIGFGWVYDSGLPVEYIPVSITAEKLERVLAGDPRVVWEWPPYAGHRRVKPLPPFEWVLEPGKQCIEVWTVGPDAPVGRVFESAGCAGGDRPSRILVPLERASLQQVVSGLDRLIIDEHRGESFTVWIAELDAWAALEALQER